MNNHRLNLPKATEKMEAQVRAVFPINITPEEFAARDGAGWLNFIFHEYRFEDPALDAWIETVGTIINDPQTLEAVQRKYLSPGEFTQMRKYMEDDELDEDNDF